jgi:predicted Fe-Mo cluster-binding NifX family protein
MKKIAFPTSDGKTLSPHLGQALYFIVACLEEDGTLVTERREKPTHQHGQKNSQDPLPDASARAGKMLVVVEDCQVLISRGLSQSAYERAQSLGMEVWLTAEKDITTALKAYLAGTLVSDLRRVHKDT